MATEVWVKAEKGHLVGVTSADRTLIEERDGETFKATLVQPRQRSMTQLALYWVMCGLLADNAQSDQIITKEMVSTVLKIETGHCDTVKFLDGTYRMQPRSVAFNKMSPEDFGKFLDKAFGVAYIKFGQDLGYAARRELEKMMGGW